MSRVFAYCRVSTTDQTAENQILEIKNAGFAIDAKRVISESVSGSIPAFERKAFAKLTDRLESGDVLVVTKLDRLGRNAMDVSATVKSLDELGVKVHCLALGGADLTSSAGKMTMQIIAAVAEFERDLLVERTQAGLNRAKAQGKRLGRPPTLTPQQKEDVLVRLAADESVSSLAKRFGVTRQTIMRARTGALV